MFQHEKGTLNLTLFDDALKQLLELSNDKLKSITNDDLEDEFLSYSNTEVSVTYNSKTKIILNIEKQQ